MFEPSTAVLAALVKHAADPPPPPPKSELQLPTRSAVELGRADSGFRVGAQLTNPWESCAAEAPS